MGRAPHSIVPRKKISKAIKTSGNQAPKIQTDMYSIQHSKPTSNKNVSSEMKLRKRGRPFGASNPNAGRKRKQPIRQPGQQRPSFAPEPSASATIQGNNSIPDPVEAHIILADLDESVDISVAYVNESEQESYVDFISSPGNMYLFTFPFPSSNKKG